MDSLDLSKTLTFTNEQLSSANQWTAKEWRQNIPNLSPEQIILIIPLATPGQDSASWKDKTHAIIEGLNTPQQLEAVGRTASFEQIGEILSWIASGNDPNQKTKLFPLFVGMSQETFLMLLIHASPTQQALLKQESISEPIQHHLTLLTHGLSSVSDIQNQTFSNLEMQLGTLDLKTIVPHQITDQEKNIEFLRETCLNTQYLASKALVIAWNSNRTDLIEKLSSIKEQSQKLANFIIGQPKHADSPSSGLFAILEARLDSVFRDENNKLINDDEPALEALVQFSIWYINDYWEVGLLPHITTSAELDLNSNESIDQQHADNRKHLFERVKENLKRLGLVTLQDLKEKRIYSKAALKGFIKDNQHILSPRREANQ